MAKIKIFSTRTCPYCHMLKEYLKSKGVTYEEVLIDTDLEGAKQSFDTCGSMAVPCTHIELDDGTEVRVLGFDRPKIDQALGLA